METSNGMSGPRQDQTSRASATDEIIGVIRKQLGELKERRKGYSLRAFAKKLNVSAPQLSQILSGRRLLTRKIATRILEGLDIEQERARRLLESI